MKKAIICVVTALALLVWGATMSESSAKRPPNGANVDTNAVKRPPNGMKLELTAVDDLKSKRRAAFDIYSYQNIVGYPVDTFIGGTDPNQARFQVKAWVKKQNDGTGWDVRTIWIDAWKEGTNPQTANCGNFFQDHAWQGDVSVKAVDSGGTQFPERFWPEVNLYKSEGCHKVLLGGDNVLNVNSDGLKIYVNGRAFMYKAHDFDTHKHLWWNATSASSWLWGCTAGPDGNRIVVCDKDGPF